VHASALVPRADGAVVASGIILAGSNSPMCPLHVGTSTGDSTPTTQADSALAVEATTAPMKAKNSFANLR